MEVVVAVGVQGVAKQAATFSRNELKARVLGLTSENVEACGPPNCACGPVPCSSCLCVMDKGDSTPAQGIPQR
jgi:hypothetical protein